MTDLPLLLAFVVAATILAITPGVDTAMVLRSAAVSGRRAAALAAAGIALGCLVWGAAVAIGLGALLRASELAYSVLKWAGAAYLLWQGGRLLLARRQLPVPGADDATAGSAAFRRGLLTNLLNPKALMFCALLLPQFISAQKDIASQYLILGSILVGTGFLFDVVYAAAASSIAGRISGSRSAGKFLKLVLSGVFGLAAVRLAIGGG